MVIGLMKHITRAASCKVARGVACVAGRFWLGAVSNKGGRGQRNREEIGAGATYIFLAASLLVRPGSTKPPRYAGYERRKITPTARFFKAGLT